MVLTHESERFRFVLETPAPIRLNSRESYVKGWFAPARGENNDSHKLAVIVDGLNVPVVSGFARPDVSRGLNDPRHRNAGFVARFRTPRWDRNIKIVWQTKQDRVVLAHLKVDIPPAGSNAVPVARASDYESWLIHREPDLFWPEDEVSDRLFALPQLPLISIILPTYNTPLYLLDRCIQSVLAQRYANWQLCISDDGSSDQTVLDYLQRMASEQPRIRLTSGFPNAGISCASNRGLERAEGEFIVLLDHDDELHPFALVEVVRRLNQVDRCDLLYSDEDKIDLYGHRSKPTFKPGFDREIFLTFDYLGHLIALRRTVAVNVGGFRPECDGAQDWDLLMRAIECIGAEAIQHIAKPLYHWRMHDQSTSVNLHSKPYARKAWTRVLSDYLARRGETAEILPGTFFGSMRLKRPVPDGARIALFIREEDGDFQVAALAKNVDAGRTSVYKLRDCGVWPVRETASAPLTLNEIDAKVFVFVNRPLETVNQLFLEELAGHALREECGLVTGLSLDAAGKVIHSGFVVAATGDLVDPYIGMELSAVAYMRQLGVTRNVEMISDEFFAIRRECLLSAAGAAAVSSGQMSRLVGTLIRQARAAGWAVIVTPFAIATFDSAVSRPMPDPVRTSAETRICLNENLEAFEDFRSIC